MVLYMENLMTITTIIQIRFIFDPFCSTYLHRFKHVFKYHQTVRSNEL